MKYILLLILFITPSLYAQVSGRVTDPTGDPLPGASVVWLGSKQGTTTSADGHFSLPDVAASRQLVVSFIGYESDTVRVQASGDELHIVLREGVQLEEVNITTRRLGTMKLRSSVLNEDMISSAELTRAACCNLGESFLTNPSVDVSYSDAATGAKQIQLLGLSGTYVQMLTENIPNYRGAAAPFGLGYIPGPWMESIQVSKGSASVKNGYEAITGQINVEFKKPQYPEADKVAVNLFAATTNRFEANADATMKLGSRWSTTLLTHYENETKMHDANDDGFADLPRVEQYNVWNRWVYMGDRYVFQAGIKALSDRRRSGQVSHGGGEIHTPYEVDIRADRYEFFAKNAYILDKVKGTNVALMLSGSTHRQDGVYGHKIYDVDQNNFYASLLYETQWRQGHNLSAGLSFNYDGFDERYRLENTELADREKRFVKEGVSGAYLQYTWDISDRLTLMAGLRGDYSNEYQFFVTPRAHVKYNPNEYLYFRLSAGKGYRTTHVLAENNYLLASSRRIVIDPKLEQEEAWNYGLSVSTYLPLWGKILNVNAEYFYTNFRRQVVVDVDTDPHAVYFTNLDGRSYSHVMQLEANYPVLKGLTLTAAYRLTDVKSTYGGVRKEKPLTGKYKGLLTASYQTPLGLWQFDATLQLNGGGRMPAPYVLDNAGTLSWKERYSGFEQLSAQVTRYFRHWSVYVGGENLTNFRQSNPIIDAANPWGDRFDATMVWGPVHGIKGYIGVRFNLARN